jgi:hypothetical protein
MAKSIALAADASRLSRLASLLLSYIPAVCAFVAPRHPGASTAIIDRLSHSRALSVRHWPFAPKRTCVEPKAHSFDDLGERRARSQHPCA